jgi:hypothetical protein
MAGFLRDENLGGVGIGVLISSRHEVIVEEPEYRARVRAFDILRLGLDLGGERFELQSATPGQRQEEGGRG